MIVPTIRNMPRPKDARVAFAWLTVNAEIAARRRPAAGSMRPAPPKVRQPMPGPRQPRRARGLFFFFFFFSASSSWLTSARNSAATRRSREDHRARVGTPCRAPGPRVGRSALSSPETGAAGVSNPWLGQHRASSSAAVSLRLIPRAMPAMRPEVELPGVARRASPMRSGRCGTAADSSACSWRRCAGRWRRRYRSVP